VLGTEGGGEVLARAAPGQPNRERKHHDTTGNMITASSHVLFLYLSKVYPNGHTSVGYLLFLQEQIKDHHHRACNRRKGRSIAWPNGCQPVAYNAPPTLCVSSSMRASHPNDERTRPLGRQVARTASCGRRRCALCLSVQRHVSYHAPHGETEPYANASL
jgi:hypothetical protein